MQALRPEVTRIVDSLLDDMIAGPRPADLVRSFSLLLPSRVICSLLGVPPGDIDTFHGWSNTLFADWSRSMGELAEAYLAMNGYMADLVAKKRQAPADDLISVLIEARDSGDRLSEAELVRFCFGLLMAGHETTANQLNMSFVALCHHPAELDRLRADPGLIPVAVEELLRFVQITGKAPPPGQDHQGSGVPWRRHDSRPGCPACGWRYPSMRSNSARDTCSPACANSRSPGMTRDLAGPGRYRSVHQLGDVRRDRAGPVRVRPWPAFPAGQRADRQGRGGAGRGGVVPG